MGKDACTEILKKKNHQEYLEKEVVTFFSFFLSYPDNQKRIDWKHLPWQRKNRTKLRYWMSVFRVSSNFLTKETPLSGFAMEKYFAVQHALLTWICREGGRKVNAALMLQTERYHLTTITRNLDSNWSIPFSASWQAVTTYCYSIVKQT